MNCEDYSMVNVVQLLVGDVLELGFSGQVWRGDEVIFFGFPEKS